MKYAHLYNPQATPQTEAIDERQVENNAGGFVYSLDKWRRLERFLILGSDSNTYYQSARSLTRENAKVVEECWASDPERTAQTIRTISMEGRAPKNDPAIFAIAMGSISKNDLARMRALAVMDSVCRTGTHLFQFVSTAKALGKGFGRGMKRAVAEWYDAKPVDKLAYQVIKYRQREGMTHENLLDLSHPTGGKTDHMRNLLYRWIVGNAEVGDTLPDIVEAHIRAMNTERASDLIPIIREQSLPWEAIPTWALNDPEVWRAMLPGLGLTAIIRNLGNMSRIGAITPMGEAEQHIVKRLGDAEEIRKSRVHPMQVLTALKIYAQGRGQQHGSKAPQTWDANQKIVGALNGAFYAAFANVIPSGKRTLLALDVSGSMGTAFIGGGVLSAREASAAMALVTMATEPLTHIVGFTSAGHSSRRFGGVWGGGQAELTPLDISPAKRLDDAVRAISNLPFGGTDCALPMIYALEKRIEVDTFQIYTDNETWAGDIHPVQALRDYRKKTGIAAKLIVVGMTSTGFSIADPADAGMLDVVGFDSSAPAVMADFARG